ncbi:TPA: ANR family transcriptional regulator [Yersinia enterocolitica]
MESLSKTDSLRQALKILGSATGRELANFTGLPIARVGALLAKDISKGHVSRCWNGNMRCYAMAGVAGVTPKSPGTPRLSHWKHAPASKKVSAKKLRCLPLGVTNPEFMSLALKAAALEKQFKYADALPVWRAAADASMLAVNEQWCFTRARFCDAARFKGWGDRS